MKKEKESKKSGKKDEKDKEKKDISKKKNERKDTKHTAITLKNNDYINNNEKDIVRKKNDKFCTFVTIMHIFFLNILKNRKSKYTSFRAESSSFFCFGRKFGKIN